jgi:hypothetical protein
LKLLSAKAARKNNAFARSKGHSGNHLIWAFKPCLKKNGMPPHNVDMDGHGAIGRFRMCACLMLWRHALKVGHVVIGGKKIAAPGAKKRGAKATAEILST